MIEHEFQDHDEIDLREPLRESTEEADDSLDNEDEYIPFENEYIEWDWE